MEGGGGGGRREAGFIERGTAVSEVKRSTAECGSTNKVFMPLNLNTLTGMLLRYV